MFKKIVGIMLLSGTLAFGQTVPTSAGTTQMPQKPDTAQLIKARLNAFKVEQKQSLALAKVQTKLALQQLKLQQVTDAANKKIAIEQTKAGK